MCVPDAGGGEGQTCNQNVGWSVGIVSFYDLSGADDHHHHVNTGAAEAKGVSDNDAMSTATPRSDVALPGNAR